MPDAQCIRSRVWCVESTRVSHHGHTGNTRHSPRNGFNGFLRALFGDRAFLPPLLARLPEQSLLERFIRLLNRKGFRFCCEYDSRCWLGGGQHLMVRPISNDLRKRAVAAVLKGESCRSVAARFGVAVSSVVKWCQRYRSTGSVAPGKMGGHRKPVLDQHQAFIMKRLNQTPHLTLHALKDELAARGVKVSHNTVWLFLRREGLRFKKNTVRP
jgi:transposase